MSRTEHLLLKDDSQAARNISYDVVFYHIKQIHIFFLLKVTKLLS